jgi:hypothetical protein
MQTEIVTPSDRQAQGERAQAAAVVGDLADLFVGVPRAGPDDLYLACVVNTVWERPGRRGALVRPVK